MLRAVVEGASQGVLAVDAEGVIQWANPVLPEQLQRNQLRRFLRDAIPLIEPFRSYQVDWQFQVKRFHVFYRTARFTGTSNLIIAQPTG